MKLLPTFLTALFACTLQAITLAWKAPVSWSGDTSWMGNNHANIADIWLYQSTNDKLTAEQVYAEAKTESNRLKQTTDPALGIEKPEDMNLTVDVRAQPENSSDLTRLGQNSYIYVVFISSGKTDPETKGQYMVAHSEKYTGQTSADGFWETSIGKQPSIGDYVDLTTIGGTWKAATPEPTALALLALGIVGLTLRRHV